MSGFVAILSFDGSPAEVSVLRRLTDFLAFRGPDAQEVWSAGPVGFGHALLRTTREAGHERQPLALDGNARIVADARVDARKDLVDALARQSGNAPAVSADAPDAELILRAYLAWGENCVDHLLGDFAFVIWDAPRRRLFAARDHFGVKPLFYAQASGALLLSNSLDCIRQHPAVSDRLNDLAIADFLLFDMNQDRATTSFADIQRLPAAHVLKCQEGSVSVRRYWTLPTASLIQYKQASEYVDHFLELLDAAVADRMRASNVGVLMSGGLDSPTVAASARRTASRCGNPVNLRAYTQVYERLIPDKERHYAGLVAATLHIPIDFLVADDCKLYDHVGDPDRLTPEPLNAPMASSEAKHLRHISTWNRVALTGFGADPGLSTFLSVHFRQLVKAGRLGRVLEDAVWYLAAEGRFSRLYLRTRWRNWFGSKKRNMPPYPDWLNEGLERRCDLRSRWEEVNHPAAPIDSVRPEAWQQTVSPLWANLFEGYDPSSTRLPLEVRHPFFDLRLVEFLIALPALPWCSDKELLRVAARGVLPEKVRLRRKSPLSADPIVPLLQESASVWVDQFEAVHELRQYVRRDRIPAVFRETDVFAAWINLRPLALNCWLQGMRPIEVQPTRQGTATLAQSISGRPHGGTLNNPG